MYITNATQLTLPEYASNIWRRVHFVRFLIFHIMKILTMDIMKLLTMDFMKLLTMDIMNLLTMHFFPGFSYFLVCQNILLSTIFSKIPTLYSFLKVRDYILYQSSSQLFNFFTHYSYEHLPKKTEQHDLVSESHFRS
jgi:hypothetical protein